MPIPKSELIVILVTNSSIKYITSLGRPAASHKTIPRDKVRWVAIFRGAPVPYRVDFLSSPFVSGSLTIALPAGGESNAETISHSAALQSFKYKVTLPTLDRSDDPEIRVGEDPYFNVACSNQWCLSPMGLLPGQEGYFTSDADGEPNESFSVQFLNGATPFEDAGTEISNVVPGETAIYRLRPVDGVTTYAFQLVSPRLGQSAQGVLGVSVPEGHSGA